MSTPSPLSTFCNMLIRFFEELRDTFPEERDIRNALETIHNAKRINPRLILDMYLTHVGTPLREQIANEDINGIISYSRQKIQTQFNEILPALVIFDRHWNTLSESNQKSIWKYLKVLIALADKAQSVRL
jgi:hypothetical protein